MEKHKTIILIVIITVIISTIGIINLNVWFDKDYENDGGIKNKTGPTEYGIAKLSKEQTRAYQNMKPDFKVGEIFEYEETMNGVDIEGSGKLIFRVDGIERMNNTDYYIVSQAMNSSFLVIDEKREKHSIEEFLEAKHYINAETGEFLKTNREIQAIRDGIVLPKTAGETIVTEDMKQVQGNIMHFPWMLLLDESFKLEVNFKYGMGAFKEDLEVIDVDNLNGRECFKIKKRLIKDMKVIDIEDIWVDKKRRILLKSDTYIDNVKTYEIKLVSKI